GAAAPCGAHCGARSLCPPCRWRNGQQHCHRGNQAAKPRQAYVVVRDRANPGNNPMSVADELNRCSATEQARLIRAKTISPVELLQAHLEAIERLDPKINAICTLAADSAMAAAKRAERAVMAGEEIGLLHGLPIGIKDVTPTAGIRTTFGSPLHADHVPTEDAAVVA